MKHMLVSRPQILVQISISQSIVQEIRIGISRFEILRKCMKARATLVRT